MTNRLSIGWALSLAIFFWGAAGGQQPPSVIDAVHQGHAVGHEQDGLEAVRTALAAGGDVNERDPADWTPLMHAALECRAGIVNLLLDRGADPKLRAKTNQSGEDMFRGQSALGVAAGCFIARRRAELAPERGMPSGYADYELAAAAKMVSALIARGAEVNAADADGRTPLMMAAMQGWRDAAGELLAAGAKVNARDSAGLAARDYADSSDRNMVALLESHGSGAPSGRSGRSVCDAERALDRLGYDMPIIDCIPGHQLRQTLLKFQQDHNLHATGELDSATKAALQIR